MLKHVKKLNIFVLCYLQCTLWRLLPQNLEFSYKKAEYNYCHIWLMNYYILFRKLFISLILKWQLFYNKNNYLTSSSASM